MKEVDLTILKNMGVNLHVPKRKNQKNDTSEKSKIILRFRYKVEHAIQAIKTLNRVRVRLDRNIQNYMSFVFLALIRKFKDPIDTPMLSEEEIEEKKVKAKIKKDKKQKFQQEALKKYTSPFGGWLKPCSQARLYCKFF